MQRFSSYSTPIKKYVHWIMVAMPIILSWNLWQVVQRQNEENNIRRFQKLASRSVDSLKNELISYENALMGARGFVYADPLNARKADHWSRFVDSIDLSERYLGMVGIGYIYDANNPERVRFSMPHLRTPSLEESFEFDLPTANQARDLGRAVISSKFRDGFILYLPLYSTRNVPSTIEERRSKFAGWVYSPLRMQRLMDDLIDTARSEVLYQIYDGTSNHSENLLYDERVLRSKVAEVNPRYEMEQVIEIAEHTWTIRIQTTRNFDHVYSNRFQLWAIPLGGLIATIAMIFTLFGLQTGRNQAMRLARNLTRSLRRKRASLLLARAVDRVIIDSATPEDGAQRILIKLGTLLKAKSTRYWVYDSSEKRAPLVLECTHEWLSPDAPFFSDEFKDYGTQLAMGSGVAGRALELRSIVWGKVGGKLSLGIPVILGDQFLGVIEIIHPNPNSIDKQIVTELTSIGGRVAQFIQAKRTEVLLREQQELLISSSKMSALGEMASGIAHEINNPLTIIHFRADQLERALQKKVDESGNDFVKLLEHSKSIKETVGRISKIIKGLRSFARNGEQDPFATTPVQTLIDDAVSLCHEKIKNRQVRLEIPPIPAGLSVDCRAVQISQVLLNLIGNAADAIEKRESRWIRVECEDLGEHVRLRIIDSGTGIAKDVAEKIFHPFFTTKPVGQGTGLGLSISSGIIRNHSGKLTIDAAHSNTCFVLELPKKQSKPTKTAA